MAIAGCTFFLAFILVVSGTSLLQVDLHWKTGADSDSFRGLRYAIQDPAARVLRSLDANSDGRLDAQEVAVFASMQNMDAAKATEEIRSIDTNGDGVLDSAEITKVFGESSSDVPEVGSNQKPAIKPVASVSAVPSSIVPNEMDLLSSSEVSTPIHATVVQGSIDETKNRDSHAPAMNAAKRIVEQLSLEESEEKEARAMDLKTAELHAKSAALVQQTVQDALDAGAKAAQEKSSEVLESIERLEDEAQHAEVKAVALQAKSKMEAEEAQELMAIANQALTH